MHQIIEFIKEYIWLILVTGIGIAAIASFIRAILELIEYLRYYRYITSPEVKNTFCATTECDGIFYYYADVRKENAAEPYPMRRVEVKVHTTITERFKPPKTFTTVNERTQYYLQYVYWKEDGGRSSFVKETSPGIYTSPLLQFNTETTVTDNEGKICHVTLLEKRVDMPTYILKQIDTEKRKLKRLKSNVYHDINKLVEDKENQNEIAAGIIADYKKAINLHVAEKLLTKPKPAPKAAEAVKKLAKELRQTEKEYLSLKFQFEKLSSEKGPTQESDLKQQK